MITIYFDIETTPILGYAWQTYKTDLLSVEKDQDLLCFAYKINDGPTKVMSRRLYTERQLVNELWKLFDSADVLVGHNGDQFDIKMSNKFFLKYKKGPPSPYKTIDTVKIARKYFRLARNKLDYISQFLFGEHKHATNMQLWFDCMAGKKPALIQMEKYNIQDVDLLHKVHMELRKWHTNGPNYNLYHGTTHQCPMCGGDTIKRGFNFTRVGKFQRYQCRSCSGWSQGEKVNADKVIK